MMPPPQEWELCPIWIQEYLGHFFYNMDDPVDCSNFAEPTLSLLNIQSYPDFYDLRKRKPFDYQQLLGTELYQQIHLGLQELTWMGYYIQTMKAHPDPTWSYGAYLELREFLMTSGKETQSLKIPVEKPPPDSPYQPPKPPPGQTPPPYTGRGPTTRRQKFSSADRVAGTPKSYHSSIPNMVNS